MADERWRECRHHHHGCACREHAWEERVATLEAEVTRLSNLVEHLEEESGQRDCAALEAEVARLETELRGWRDAVSDATNAACSCGGAGPDDVSACPACLIYHAIIGRAT